MFQLERWNDELAGEEGVGARAGRGLSGAEGEIFLSMAGVCRWAQKVGGWRWLLIGLVGC